MTEIRFYHLQTQSLEQALPAILQKAFQTDKNIIVRLRNDSEVERMNKHLWTFNSDVFLPHGSDKDGYADRQPIWLSSKKDNPNGAKILILTQGMADEGIKDYDLCCEMLNGHDDDAVQTARNRWKDYQSQGFDVTYWQQTANGGWDKKS